TSFARRRVSEIARPQHELVRLYLTHRHGPKRWASSSKVTSPSARMSNLRRRRSLAVYAARANSLEFAFVFPCNLITVPTETDRHASRRTSMLLSKPVAPNLRSRMIIGDEGGD